MRRNVSIVAVVALGAMALSGCAHGGGLDRSRPDEFAVARQAPLTVPPDFALVPPAPGTARPQDATTNAETLQALFGGPAQRSASESVVGSEAGGDDAAAGIRSSVGDPGTNVVDKGSTTRDIVAAPEGDGQDARAATTPTAATTPK